MTDAWKAKAVLDGTEGKIGDKPISDFISEFAGSDLGKHYVTAPLNTGSGATGPKTVTTDKAPDVWNFTKYAEMKKENPTGAEAYAKAHNQPF